MAKFNAVKEVAGEVLCVVAEETLWQKVKFIVLYLRGRATMCVIIDKKYFTTVQ